VFKGVGHAHVSADQIVAPAAIHLNAPHVASTAHRDRAAASDAVKHLIPDHAARGRSVDRISTLGCRAAEAVKGSDQPGSDFHDMLRSLVVWMLIRNLCSPGRVGRAADSRRMGATAPRRNHRPLPEPVVLNAGIRHTID